VSQALVAKWRRLARKWQAAAEEEPLDNFATRTDRYARADTFNRCADSLQRSIEIAQRKARVRAAGGAR
jgi:hypothetical protein